MSTTFMILMGIAMASVLIVLMVGIISMAKGGEFNKKYGNKLMQARVICQGLAICFFILAIIAKS